MQFISVLFSSVQFYSVQFSSIQFSLFSTVQFYSVQFSSIQFSSVLFSSVQFKGSAVVRVEFMVDQVAGADLPAPACNESKTAPFSRAPGAV
jgi:uncharacterized protein YjbI with pentapeptide repeats